MQSQNPKPYYRGHPPHFDAELTYQFVTFRLADSLPRSKREQLEEELAREPADRRERERYKRVECWLDAGLGSCALRHPAMAEIVFRALQHFDESRYRLIAWCIMPNHVHVLVQTRAPLPKIVQSWKSYTGRWALKHCTELELGVPRGATTFWMRDYWDRYIRNEHHYAAVVRYIHSNPVKAGLCKRPEQWRWSSAAGSVPDKE